MIVIDAARPAGVPVGSYQQHRFRVTVQTRAPNRRYMPLNVVLRSAMNEAPIRWRNANVETGSGGHCRQILVKDCPSIPGEVDPNVFWIIRPSPSTRIPVLGCLADGICVSIEGWVIDGGCVPADIPSRLTPTTPKFLPDLPVRAPHKNLQMVGLHECGGRVVCQHSPVVVTLPRAPDPGSEASLPKSVVFAADEQIARDWALRHRRSADKSRRRSA